MLGVGNGGERLGIYVGGVEEGVGVSRHRIFRVARDLGVEELARVRDPTRVLVFFRVDVKVARTAVRVFAVIDLVPNQMALH